MKDGRLFARAIFLICIVLCLTPCAFADISDDFTTGSVGEYTNLNAVSAKSLGWSGVSDARVLVQGSGNVSTALYPCTGAKSVQVTLYSTLPAYAVKTADGQPARVRTAGTRYALRYCAEDDLVYLNCDGETYSGSYDLARGEYRFFACDSIPAGSIRYGVSVWYRQNGAYREASLTLTADSACTGCFMQRYSAAIPAGADAVRITLTEQNQVPVLGRSARHQMRTPGSLALGNVFIAGAVPLSGGSQPVEEPTPGGSGDFFLDEIENYLEETDGLSDADAYDPYYDAILPDPAMLEQMQDYREAVTAYLREQQEAPEELPDSQLPAEWGTENNRREKTDEAENGDVETPEGELSPAAPVRLEADGTFWQKADLVTAGLILLLGALAAARILIGGKKQ